MKLLKTRLGSALAFRLSIILFVTMIALGGLAMLFIHNFGSYTIDINEAGMRKQLSALLMTSINEEAEKYTAYFKHTDIFVGDLGRMAQNYLDHPEIYGNANVNPNEKLVYYPEKKMFSNQKTEPVMVLFGEPYKDQKITAKARQDMNALSHLDSWLVTFKNNYPYYIASWVDAENGVMRYYPNIHFVDEIPADYSVSKAIYYIIANPKNNPERKVCWSNIYRDVTGMDMISISAPIYDKNDSFYGVTGVDIDVNKLIADISDKKVRQKKRVAPYDIENVFSMLTQKNGGITAIWGQQAELLGIEKANSSEVDYYHYLPRSLQKSKLPDVRQLAEYVKYNENGIKTVTLADGKRYLCAFARIAINDWTLFAFADEEEVFSPVVKTKDTMEASISKLIVWMLLLISGIVSATYILIMRFLNKRVHIPVLALEREMHKIAEVKSTGSLKVYYADEIGALTKRFNTMSHEIKNYRNNMEELVAERTLELADTNEELQRARDRAEVASSAKSLFISKMSHELRTPLNVILGYAEILEQHLTKSDLTQQTKGITASGRHLLELINNILDVARMEAGRIDLDYKDIDINLLLTETKYVFQHLVDEKGLKLLVDISDNISGYLKLDPVRLRQVLYNLVGNAVKFTEKGFIKISVKADKVDHLNKKMNIMINVHDTGIGIDKAELDTIFTAFSQVNQRIEGAGLGLAICKHIIQQMNGTLSAKSTLGIGSDFEVIIANVDFTETDMIMQDDDVIADDDQVNKIMEATDELKFQDHDLMKTWRDLSQSVVFEDIEEFGREVNEIAEEKQLPKLLDWSCVIIKIAQSYDIGRLKKEFKKFPEIFENEWMK